MKKLLLTMLALSLFGAVAMAQVPKGSVLLGTSTEIWGGVNNIHDLAPANSGGFSFSKTKFKYGGESIDGPKTTLVNLSPRLGYAFADGLIGGAKLDFFYLKSKDSDDSETTSTGIGAGPFIRYIVPNAGKVKPFVEVEATFGTIKEKYDEEESTDNTASFGGGLGLAFFFNEHAALDVMAGYFYDSAKDPDVDDAKNTASGFGLGLGLTVFLSPTK